MTSKLNKHVFASSKDCIFVMVLLKNMVYRNILKKEDILIAVHDGNGNRKTIYQDCKKNSFEVCEFEELFERDDVNIISFNPMSLNTKNSKYICGLLDAGKITPEQINIILTDNEVDRWNLLYQEKGGLDVSEKYLIDKHVLKLLNLDILYVGPNSLIKVLDNILNKKVRNLEYFLPVTILPSSELDVLCDFFKYNYLPLTNKKSVMFFTKPSLEPHKFNFLFELARYFFFEHKCMSGQEIKLGIWSSINNKIIFFYQVLCIVLRKIKKINLNIEMLHPASAIGYLSKLHEYDALVLQRRGGVTTAKYFAENIGPILLKEGSENEEMFGKDYGLNELDNFSYKNLRDALKLALSDDISRHKDQVAERVKFHNELAIEKLKDFYSGF